jgi:hypothetical protein
MSIAENLKKVLDDIESVQLSSTNVKPENLILNILYVIYFMKAMVFIKRPANKQFA